MSYDNVAYLLSTCYYLPGSVMQLAVDLLLSLSREGRDERLRLWRERERPSVVAELPGEPVAPSQDATLSRLGARVTRERVIVLPVHGVFGKRMSSFDISTRGISSEMLTDAFETLAEAEDVAGVVLSVDSPGGTVLGTESAARALFRLRRTKPVYAVADEMMASAAYYLGAQATEIYAPPSAVVGSIGVYALRVDATEALSREGLSVTLVSRGAYKTDGHPAREVSDAEIARLQEQVDTYYRQFVAAVSRGRGITLENAEKLADGRAVVAESAVGTYIDGAAFLREVVSRADLQARKRGITVYQNQEVS